MYLNWRNQPMPPINEFIRQFEHLELDPTLLTHKGHLKLCWYYLKQYPFQRACHMISQGLLRYASSLDAEDKYHLTLTMAFIYIINERIRSRPSACFNEFLDNNPDILKDAKSTIFLYYSKKRLHSPEARIHFLQADKKQLPGWR